MLMKELLVVEMSTVCSKKDNYGFIARIFSNDHNPPHIHIFDVSENEICRILITDKKPNDFYDLRTLSVDNERDFSKIREKILEFANSRNKYGFNNWDFLKATWESYHSDEKVKYS